LRRQLDSADFFSECAIRVALADLKMDCSRSSASLRRLTAPDHFFATVLFAAVLLGARFPVFLPAARVRGWRRLIEVFMRRFKMRSPPAAISECARGAVGLHRRGVGTSQWPDEA
jgi:hypothetical protein